MSSVVLSLLEPEKTSVCPHSDGRPVLGTLVSCPEMSPLRVWCRSALPRNRDLTCALTELEPTVYERPSRSALATAVLHERLLCQIPFPNTCMCSGERPTSLCLGTCGVTCARCYATWSGLLRVTLELWPLASRSLSFYMCPHPLAQHLHPSSKPVESCGASPNKLSSLLHFR